MELQNKEYVMRLYTLETSLKTIAPLTLVALSASLQGSESLNPSLFETKKFSQFRQFGHMALTNGTN